MKSINVGEEVIALGSPLAIDFSISNGIVTGLHRDLGVGYFDLLQTNAAINPGNSGGPLVDLHGRLVGINVASMSPGFDGDFSGIGFAVPADVAQTFILEYLWR
jgi:S1-C subfamily serine protease